MTREFCRMMYGRIIDLKAFQIILPHIILRENAVVMGLMDRFSENIAVGM